jgi:hypothetical protein
MTAAASVAAGISPRSTARCTTALGLPVAVLRPLVGRRWNRAFQDAVDGLIRRAGQGSHASR